MAEIIGAIATTHVPALGKAIAEGREQEPYWKPFFDGFAFVRKWLAERQPDTVVVFSNDHGLNFFLDKMPTFAVGAADEYRSEDEGWGIPVAPPVKGDAELSWKVIEWLVHGEFDVTTCQEMLLDHAVTIPLQMLWPDAAQRNIHIVPISINTVQHPLPSPTRCLKFGRAVGRVLRLLPQDDGRRILILGTGGLSHQLDGARAGFINKDFDLLCLDRIVRDPDALTTYSVHDIVALAGAQGVELLNWIAMRGALLGDVSEAFRNYHIPISNTAAATLVLENS
jgi:protocatechuate 4,5-dioxygenase beta chain